MNRIKSLALTFTLAAASLVGLGNRAQAQTVPVNQGQPVYTQSYNATSYVSQDAIDDVAYNVGVQSVYPRARLGYTAAVAQNGENIGLEFELNGGQASVIRAFNLNNTASANAFERARDGAAAVDNNLAADTRIYIQRYPSYIICAPVRPILGIGWLLRPHGWEDPFYRDHGRNWYNDRPRHDFPIFTPQPRYLHEQPRFDRPHYEQPRDNHRYEAPRNDNRGHEDRSRNDRGGHVNRGPHR